MPLPEAKKILMQADFGLIPLKELEGFNTALPTKMFEYMAMELCVVMCRIPNWETIVDRYECGFSVNWDKPKEVVDKIIISYQTGQYAKMGENGKRAVRIYFNWKNEEKKILRFFKGFLDYD